MDIKKVFLLLFLSVSVVSFAQEKVQKVVQDSYKRNSLSIIVVDRGDSYDEQVFNAVKSINKGDKFDENLIDTDCFTIKESRDTLISSAAIDNEVLKADVAKQIISCWYQRDDNGIMSDELVLARGHYNADDQEYMNSQISKLGVAGLGEAGHALVQGSYVLVLDHSRFVKGKDLFGAENWTVTTTARVYIVNYPKEVCDQVYATWIYEDDSPQQIAEKNAAYDALQIDLYPLASVVVAASATVGDGGIPAAIANGYVSAIIGLESKIEAWKVTVPIFTLDPVSAKIGTKEGLKNTSRYQAFSFFEDANSVLQSEKKGYVRATVIADNRTVSVGDSKMSEFYQISGGQLETGMLLKQSNDLGMGLSVGYQMGGMGALNVMVDYLTHINTKGTSQYALIDFRYDLVSGSKMKEEFESNTKVDLGMSYVSFGIGYGIGFRPLRFIEVMPYLTVGGEYMMFNSEFSDAVSTTEDELMDDIALYANAGVRANFTVAYPFQVFAGVDYTLMFSEGSTYKHYNDLFEGMKGIERKGGIGFTVGAKFTF